MKKALSSVSLAIISLVLAGCSLAPVNTKTTDEPIDQAKSNGSLWESVDGGKTWLDKSMGNAKSADISNVDIISLAINPYDANIAYAGARGAGILKTEDGGQSWAYLEFQSEKIYGLDIDPIDAKIIYASGVWQKRGKIFKSSDSGKTWKEIYTSPAVGPIIISLVIDKNNSNIVYAATSDNQVIKTVDGGGSWKNIFEAPGPIIRVALGKATGSLMYMLTLSGEIFKSTDGGKNFENISKNMSNIGGNSQDISILETDPVQANTVYVAGGVGMLRSRDAGKNWEKIEVLSNSRDFPVKALTINPTNPKELIYGAAKTVYKSVDDGLSWTTMQFEIIKNLNVLKYASANPANLYLGLSK